MSEEPARKKLRGDVKPKDKITNNQLLLYNAVKENDKKSIDKLLDQRKGTININFTSKLYRPVLHLAIEANNYELVKKLIAVGANVNLRSLREHRDYSHLNLPLHLAVFEGHKKIVELLLENKADVNAAEGKETPLSIAADRNHFKIAKLLIDAGAEVNPSKSEKPLIAGIGYTSMVEYLIKKGADVNALAIDDDDYRRLRTYTTPMETAILRRNTDAMKLLIDNKANVNWIGTFGSLLRTAAISGSPKVVRMLLNCDNLIVNPSSGQSALHIEEYDSFEPSINFQRLVIALLDAGVDINKLSESGETIVDYCRKYPAVVRKSIFEHIVKLKAAGLYVNDNILTAVEGEAYESLFKSCYSEIEMMKEKKILNINFSFFDVLHKSSDIVALALLIAEQKRCINERILQQQFPLYGGMIYYCLKKAFYRRKLLVKVDEMLFVIFNAELPDVIKRMIYLYLSNEDLKLLL